MSGNDALQTVKATTPETLLILCKDQCPWSK